MYKVTKRDCPMFGIGPYVCEFICDTASDITTLPTSISEGTGGRTAYDNQKCASGSIAIVASGSESKQYMLNNQDIWCPYSVAAGSSSGGSSESSITVDFALSETSENPVANKAITAALNNKADTTHTHTADEVGADESGSAASALVEAKAYTDSEIADAMAENQTVVEALDAAIGTKANKTDIPTKVSQLDNDLGYLTEDDIPDLSPYAKKADVPKIKVNAAVNADTVGGLAANEIARNPNLLINPDFKINQRGLTVYHDAVYSVDRWMIPTNGCEISLVSNGLKIKRIDERNGLTLKQPIENVSDLAGKQVTVSVYISEISGYSHQIRLQTNLETSSAEITNLGITSFTTTISKNVSSMFIGFSSTGPNDHIICNWVKLEIGNTATPFIPPEPTTELLKCQRYYFSMPTNGTSVSNSAMGIATNNTCISLGFLFPTEMRAVPTISISYLARWDTSKTNENTICEPQHTTKKGIPCLMSDNKEFVAGTIYYLCFSADAEMY